MAAVEEFQQRNAAFAGGDHPELPLIPTRRTLIVACADHRADPTHAFGLEPGEAIVFRTAGGRVTPAILQNLAIVGEVAREQSARRGYELPKFELLLVHHTGCGLSLIDQEKHGDLLAYYMGVDKQELPSRHLADPHEAVRTDIELLAANPAVPASLSVAGFVIDIDSREAELIERRSPLRED